MDHGKDDNSDIRRKKGESKSDNQNPIDFAAINGIILCDLLNLLRHWLPGGRIEGDEYVPLNPTRNDRKPGSFRINLKTGKWADFATDAKGGDPISLYAYLKKMSQTEAAQELARKFGANISEHKEKRSAESEGNLTPIIPASIPFEVPYHKRGKPVAFWEYKDRNSNLLGAVCRFNRPNGEKDILPLICCRDKKTGEVLWVWQSFCKPRPLYGLPELEAKPNVPVLIVEGEKTAEAGRKLYSTYAVITWPGGANAYPYADWNELSGRKVYLFPDNDKAGFDAMHGIGEILKGVADEIKFILPPENAKQGWDIADANWSPDEALAYVKNNITPSLNGYGKEKSTKILPDILIAGGDLSQLATEGETAIMSAGYPIYARNARLVRPVLQEVMASNNRKTKICHLVEVTSPYMLDKLSSAAKWWHYNSRSKSDIRVNPPPRVADIILERYGDWRFFPIVAVINTPTLRPDGSILQRPGYDPATRLLLTGCYGAPIIKESPSRDDAIAALSILEDLITEFPFVDGASKSVALSALITPIVRGLFLVTPLHSICAPTPGSGKSFLIDVMAAIAIGQPCPVMAAGRTEEETEKRLVAALLSGQSIISLDNVNGDLGGDMLCQIVERPIIQMRPLGKSERVQIENRSTLYATGNNLRLVGDMTRRVLICNLDANVERPELRQFKSNPVQRILDDRDRYIAAAITVVRAYIIAGKPNPAPKLASFEGWSDHVRSALIWLGKEDPVKTMEKARSEDPHLQSMTMVFSSLKEIFGVKSPVTAREMIERAYEKIIRDLDSHNEQRKYPEFYDALLAICGKKGILDSLALGKWLSRNKGRIACDVRLENESDKHGHTVKWYLVSAGQADQSGSI